MTYRNANPCSNCGSTDLIVEEDQPRPSQYNRIACNSCGKKGAFDYFTKGCGMEEIEDIMLDNWNRENPQESRP